MNRKRPKRGLIDKWSIRLQCNLLERQQSKELVKEVIRNFTGDAKNAIRENGR